MIMFIFNEASKNILRKILKEAGSEIKIITGSDKVEIIRHIILDPIGRE